MINLENILFLGGTTQIFTIVIHGLIIGKSITDILDRCTTQKELSCMLVIGLTGEIGGESEEKCTVCSTHGFTIVTEMDSYGIILIMIAMWTNYTLPL